MKRFVLALLFGVIVTLAAGCGSHHDGSQYGKVERHAKQQRAYIPHNDVELHNYNRAQQLYDSPSTIIWCTTTWGNASSPMVTVPVAGKLTSSSTTFFSPEYWTGDGDGNVVLPSRSVDGLYHPNPPGYRYGFTPGGQYVDFFNMPTLCTTAMTKFQRQSTKVTISVDAQAAKAQQAAEAALKAGTDSHGNVSPAAQRRAQAILTGAGLGG